MRLELPWQIIHSQNPPFLIHVSCFPDFLSSLYLSFVFKFLLHPEKVMEGRKTSFLIHSNKNKFVSVFPQNLLRSYIGSMIYQISFKPLFPDFVKGKESPFKYRDDKLLASNRVLVWMPKLFQSLRDGETSTALF